jgi:hypothetical protein
MSRKMRPLRVLPLLLLPLPAFADAGGPIIWLVAGVVWFAFAQALIVAVEYACLLLSEKEISKGRLLLWVILANAVSGAAGFFVLAAEGALWFNNDRSGLTFLVSWFLITFVISVYLEWLVFKGLYLRRGLDAGRALLRRMVICNAASYLSLAALVALILAGVRSH